MTTTACAFSMTSSRISPTYGLAPFDLACLRAWSHSMGCNPSARRKSNILFRKASSRPWTTNTDLPFVFRTAFLTFDARRGGSASLRSRSGVMLSKQLLTILRTYWRAAHLQDLLFPGPDPKRPITVRSAVRVAGLDSSVTVHTLRHSFATHLLEQGVDIRVIQDLLGHRHIKSTVGYARVAIDMIRQVQSPLELLNMAATAPD